MTLMFKAYDGTERFGIKPDWYLLDFSKELESLLSNYFHYYHQQKSKYYKNYCGLIMVRLTMFISLII